MNLLLCIFAYFIRHKIGICVCFTDIVAYRAPRTKQRYVPNYSSLKESLKCHNCFVMTMTIYSLHQRGRGLLKCWQSRDDSISLIRQHGTPAIQWIQPNIAQLDVPEREHRSTVLRFYFHCEFYFSLCEQLFMFVLRYIDIFHALWYVCIFLFIWNLHCTDMRLNTNYTVVCNDNMTGKDRQAPTEHSLS